METLGKVSGGDLRKAITTLQSAVRLKVSSTSPFTSAACRASKHQQKLLAAEHAPYSELLRDMAI